VAGEAGLRFRDVGHGLAAESESIVGAGFAGGLGGGWPDRRRHCGGEGAEGHGGREPDKISLNILHLHNPLVMPRSCRTRPLTVTRRRRAKEEVVIAEIGLVADVPMAPELQSP
jgi:hypothetical protein